MVNFVYIRLFHIECEITTTRLEGINLKEWSDEWLIKQAEELGLKIGYVKLGEEE